MRPLLLINPNTNEATTAAMVDIARKSAPSEVTVEGATVLRGAPLIYDEDKLAVSAAAVLELASEIDLTKYSGIIISAFGDPALDALRSIAPVPVTGIAEAGIVEAAGSGRRFSIVTTTPHLVAAIHNCVEKHGYGYLFAGVELTEGDVVQLMEEPLRLQDSLARGCERAINAGAEAIIIGGGPLAVHAVPLRSRFQVPIIEPVPAAVRLGAMRAGLQTEAAE
jgi:allantoin racemase